jgi:hypothetical protein
MAKRKPTKKKPISVVATPVTDRLVSLIDADTSSIGTGELTFDVRMARFKGWSEQEISQCYQQLEGVYHQWKRLVELRRLQNMIQCRTCGSLQSADYFYRDRKCSNCRNPLGDS